MYYFLPKARRSGRSTPTASRSCISGRWSSSTSGPGPHHLLYTALPDWAQTLGMIFSVMLWAPVLGRHAQRPAHPARRLGQAAHRPRDQVLRRGRHLLRHVHLRGPAAVDQERQRAGPLHRLDHRPRPRRRAGLERLHGLRHALLAGAAPVGAPSCGASAWPRRTSGSRPSASCSTWSRCGSAASARASSGARSTPTASSSTPTSSRACSPRRLMYQMRLHRRLALLRQLPAGRRQPGR